MGKVDDAVQTLINHAVELGLTDITALVASIPDSKSAIQLGGDEATIKFDVPRTAPLFGNSQHRQRPAVMTLDMWQEEHRPIILIAILMPSAQIEMDLGGDKKETPKETPPTNGTDPSEEAWPSTTSPAPVIYEQHLHITANDALKLKRVTSYGGELLALQDGGDGEPE